MKKLQIVRVDNDLVQKVNLQLGNNIIGRGAATGCQEDRIIKHAVVINLAPNDEMTITPYQVSPCYMKSTQSSRWELLKLGTTVPIRPGDVCSLLPEKCWFKVISTCDMQNVQDQTSKRKAEEDVNYESPDKKSRLDARINDSIPKTETSSCISDNNVPKVPKIEEVETASNSMGQEKVCASNSKDENTVGTAKVGSSNNVETVFKNEEVKESFKKDLSKCSQKKSNTLTTKEDTQSSILVQEVVPSGSANAIQSIPRRNKYEHEKKCYSKNSSRKTNFSHPDDSDYDISDDEEECIYGIPLICHYPGHRQQSKRTTFVRRYRKTNNDDSTDYSESSGLSEEESVDESDNVPSSSGDSTDDELEYKYGREDGERWSWSR